MKDQNSWHQIVIKLKILHPLQWSGYITNFVVLIALKEEAPLVTLGQTMIITSFKTCLAFKQIKILMIIAYYEENAYFEYYALNIFTCCQCSSTLK